MTGNVFGLDLGTYEIKVYDKKTDQIWWQKDAIAMKKKKFIFAFGNAAYDMFEKSPEDIQVIFPMKNGVIAHFDDMQYLLGGLLEPSKRFLRGAQYVVAVPTDVTEVEKKAFYDLVFHSEAKAKTVRVVERGLADAVGCGLDVINDKGIFIANFGAGTTELSVLSFGGMVMNRLLKTGGEDFDKAIAGLVRHNLDFLIGVTTAERLRREFGIFDQSTDSSITVSGRNLVSGVPSQTEVSISLVRAAMKEPLDECVHAIKTMFERTPPDVRKSIEKTGIYLTGGIANLRGLPTYLQESTGLKINMPADPELSAVRGLRTIINDKKNYSRLTYSMLDEKNRWLR